MSSSDKLKIPFEEIRLATNDFAEANIIGKGGYGTVYKGESKEHGVLAIKRLNRLHGQGDHEYGMEITLLSKYKHENLVSLIGYCGEDGEKILVYKYEPNQSLDKFLQSKDLSWTLRLQICLGAARGLSYLHNETGSEHVVIHRDVKCSNILLDENWNAKISDFGLSKIALTTSANSVIFTGACGTPGYFDPQILYGCITQKSDVYSFGVVLFEVLFGKFVSHPGYLGHTRFTVKMAKKHCKEKTLHMMIHPDLRSEINTDSLTIFSDIACRCLKKHTKDRPTMSLVAEALGKALRYQQVGSPIESFDGSGSGDNLAIVLVQPEVSHLGWGHWYTMRELEVATNGFSDENVIGKGGFGIVYSGVLADETMVAVKNLLNNRGQTEKEFRVEVEAIGVVRHKNLVRLLGYCAEGAQRILVYEYVNNGNLEQWLHGDVGPISPLTWEIRMNIVLGTAKGLTYLYEGLETKVIHRDIKSSNILLDRQWHPKVSDFGLAKLLGSESMGTFGYVAPEYACTGMLNEMSDVYSFGILIMEIISGRNPVDYSRPPDEVNLVDWLKTVVRNRNVEGVLDPKLPEKPSSRALKRALLVALRCVDPSAQDRPKMGQVIHMLEAVDFPFR